MPGLSLAIVGGGRLRARESTFLSRLLPGRWVHLDGITTAALNAVYNLAFALIYPSDYEGFGLPLLEAMAAGCPVIALRRSSVPEVAGDAALLVDRADPEILRERLQELDSTELRAGLISRGRLHAARFSWDRCYAETRAFYVDVLAQSRG
jgi:mannosyltransferase